MTFMVRVPSERYVKGVHDMKGYYVSYGYMGFIGGEYKLFATETDYIEAYKDKEK